jgi:hypothetical protein
MWILQAKFLRCVAGNVPIFFGVFFWMPVQSLPLCLFTSENMSLVMLRLVRNEFQMVFWSRLPFFSFQNASHFEKKSNIVSRNTVEMCVVRCKGNSVIFLYWKNVTKTWKHFPFTFRCLETFLAHCRNVTHNNLVLTNFMDHNFFHEKLTLVYLIMNLSMLSAIRRSSRNIGKICTLSVCQVSSIQLVISYPVFWHVYVLGLGYFVWPWSPHRHRKSPHRHRTFRDVTPGPLTVTDMCIMYHLTNFDVSRNVIFHMRYVSTCVGARVVGE